MNYGPIIILSGIAFPIQQNNMFCVSKILKTLKAVTSRRQVLIQVERDIVLIAYLQPFLKDEIAFGGRRCPATQLTALD